MKVRIHHQVNDVKIWMNPKPHPPLSTVCTLLYNFEAQTFINKEATGKNFICKISNFLSRKSHA